MIKGITYFFVLTSILFLFTRCKIGEKKKIVEDTKRPNIIVIIADDLGYSDIGCYGGEINTPQYRLSCQEWSAFFAVL